MNLSGRVVRAAKSNYVGAFARVLAQLLSQIALMRYLGPDAIGSFGYVLLINGALALLVDQGFGWSLVQSEFDDREVAVALTRLLLAGAAAGFVVFVASYPIALWLSNPLAGQLIRWSAPSYLLIGLYAVSHARLRRDLRFRELQLATNGAYMVAYPCVGLGMALTGWGVWSLVGAWYAQGLLQVAIGHFYATHSLKLALPWHRCARAPLGRRVAAINLLGWMVDNGGGVAAGLVGASALGSYNAASAVARQPAVQVAQTLQALMFSTASSISGDRDKVRRLCLASLALLAFALGPVYAYFGVNAGTIVALLLGSEWATASGILRALSTGMLPFALSLVIGAILTAIGKQAEVIASHAICLIVMLVGFAVTSGSPVENVAWIVSGALCLRFGWQLATLIGTRIVSSSDVYVCLRGPIVMAVVALMPVQDWISTGRSQWFDEVLGVAVLAIVMLMVLRMRPEFFVAPVIDELLAHTAAGRRIRHLIRLGSREVKAV